MACACGSKKAAEKKGFVVTLPGGRTKSYASEAAAKAEAQRQGGTYRPA
jgi:hypothetical protein